MEKKYYSNSKLETFDQCKLRYKFQYIDKIQVDIPTTIEAFMGNMVHDTLEKLYSLVELRLPELKEILEFYSKKWNESYTPNILIAKPYLTQEDYKKLGEKFRVYDQAKGIIRAAFTDLLSYKNEVAKNEEIVNKAR